PPSAINSPAACTRNGKTASAAAVSTPPAHGFVIMFIVSLSLLVRPRNRLKRLPQDELVEAFLISSRAGFCGLVATLCVSTNSHDFPKKQALAPLPISSTKNAPPSYIFCMPRHAPIETAERDFFQLIARTTACNPFSEERTDLDARIVGHPVEMFSDAHLEE